MKGLSYGTPAWGDAGVIVPWDIYEAYCDTRILERSVDSMVRFLDDCNHPAVKANIDVSHLLLASDFSEAAGQLTPTLGRCRMRIPLAGVGR